MVKNYNFGDYKELAPVAINEAHMPVVIVADVSGSMGGKPIEMLNKSINRFKDDVLKDSRASERVDIAVVGFNEEPRIEQNWRPIIEMGPVNYTAGGGTNLSSALELGVEMLKSRSHLYEDNGIEVKMPYLILITDGYGGDVSDISKVIKQRTNEHKMKLWILAVKGYDKNTIAQLTDEGKRAFELVDEDGYDFTEFFSFMAASTKINSVSRYGETIIVDSNIGQEGSNCRAIDLTDWLNN